MARPRRELAACRKAAGFSQESLAHVIGVDRSTVARWESGGTAPQPELRAKLARRLGLDLAGLRELLDSDSPEPRSADGAVASGPPDAEASRQALHELLVLSPSAAGLEDWEQAAWRYGQAAKDRSPALLLADLVADFDALVPVMTACRSATALRRLTRVAAQLAGLVCLTLIKLDDRQAFRAWARTARLAAAEVDDPATHAWVLAHEAYGHFYSRDLHEAVAIAEQAQTLLSGLRGQAAVGGVLAAALEARAQAALGRADATHAALRRSEQLLAHVEQPTAPSAFGYDEAQLRFHESNALTHLGDVTGAWAAQDRALELVAADDYMDRSMTLLDRALCVLRSGDLSLAMTLSRDCLLTLDHEQRRGIIAGRAWQVLDSVPADARQHAATIELRDLLMTTTASPKDLLS